ncbi:MAG: hypothetical protein IT372_34285 [Polyangiaceae bacterium]|nr:hypothetical protein [Polyangiaceae bacterium]
MDPVMQPIQGISLERYADRGAALDGTNNDPEAVRRVLAAEGVREADWEAAKTGWTARMQDMSLMGRVAMAYMPMYQAALARRKGGAASLSYEDFVHVSAVIKVIGFEGAMGACGLSQSDWTEAAGQWNNTMAQNMGQYAGHHGYVGQEEARFRAGGPPRRVQITRVAGSAPAAQPAYMQAALHTPGATGMDAAMAQAMNNPMMQQQLAAQAAIQANPMGFAMGQVGAFMSGGITAGSRVMVAWSDGNSYPGQVLQAAPDQYQVQFQNGSQQWIPAQYVRKA